jgi:arylsulfatase
VIDVAPTLLEVAGLPQPASKHRTPWQTTDEVGIAFDDDVWELYDGASDWTQARNQAAERPDRLRELQRLFLIEATRYNVLPLDDRGFERATPETAGRPALIQGTSQVLFDGMSGLNEHCVVNVRNKSHSVTAELVVPDDGADGVLINQGGIAAGWALYVNDGRLRYRYNYFNLERTAVTAEQPLPAGAHQVRMEFAYDGGGVGKGGTVTLYLDGSPIGAGRLPRTVPIGFSADETTDVGRDTDSPVSDDYPATGNDFTGTINWVRIDLGDDSHDHQIDPAQLLHLAMAANDPQFAVRQGRGSSRSSEKMSTSILRPPWKKAPRAVPSSWNPHFSAIRRLGVFPGTITSEMRLTFFAPNR